MCIKNKLIYVAIAMILGLFSPAFAKETQPAYTLTPTNDANLSNVITKYVYDENNYTITPNYYQVNLAKTNYGVESGETSTKYFNWTSDANGNKTLTEGTSATGVNSITYKLFTDPSIPNATDRITTNQNGINIVSHFEGLYNKQTSNSAFGGVINNNNGSIGNITANFISNYTQSNTDALGGVFYNLNGNIGNITGDFIGNYAKGNNAAGGVLYNYKYTTIGDITGNFIANYVEGETAKGGVIYNYETINNITGDFISNYAKGGTAKGGAIFNCGDKYIHNINGNFVNNYVNAQNRTAYGGAVYNNNAKIDNLTGDFIGNYAKGNTETKGGAIYNTLAYIGDIKGDFIGNYASSNGTAYGGAIYNYGKDTKIENITGNFINNYIKANQTYGKGGAIYNELSTIDNIKGDFIGNTAEAVYAQGGAIYNSGNIGTITGNFIQNITKGGAGGAISNVEGKITSIHGNFIENGGTIDNVWGGAIYNYKSTIGDIVGDFIGNYGIASDFTYSGAIYNAYGNINSITGNFVNNYIKSAESYAYGGAIFNHVDSTIIDIKGDFIENHAESLKDYSAGGAIYNVNGIINNIAGNFINNYAKAYDTTALGGAIGNRSGTIENITGDFYGNYAISNSSAIGGAIDNEGTVKNIIGNFVENYVSGEYAEGGAIDNFEGTINHIAGNFIGNYATSTDDLAVGGAIANIGTINEIVNSNFAHNYTKSTYSLSYGGAIYNEGTIGKIEGNFVENNVLSNSPPSHGGAIYNKNKIGNITGDFIGNYAKTNNAQAYGGAIYNDQGTIGNIKGDFTNNYAESVTAPANGGAINNDNGNIGNITGDFIGNYTESQFANGGAIYNEKGNIGNITGDFINNFTKGKNQIAFGGAIYNNGDIKNIIGDFIGNYTDTSRNPAMGGAIYNSNSIGEKDTNGNLIGGIINSNFINNHAKSDYAIAFGGAIYSTKDLNIIADKGVSEFKGNYTEANGIKDDNAIYMNSSSAKLSLITKNNGNIILHDNVRGANGYKVDITGDGTGTLHLYNDLHNANVSINNTLINTINNNTHDYKFNTLTLNGNTNIAVDVDLANETMDRFSANSYGSHKGKLNVVGMNLISDALNAQTKIEFADADLKDHVVNNINGQLPNSKFQTVAFTPIYKYDVTYDKSGEKGFFLFARSNGNNNSSIENFNPAIVGGSTSATVGGMGTVNQTFNYAFGNADTYMNIPYLERVSMKMKNRYALALTEPDNSLGRFSPLYLPENEGADIWVKPYSTFESIPLKNGPKVDNITYGTLIGFDTDIQEIKNGWDRVITGYIGYNGANQSYAGVDSVQNGGLLGGTLTLYKGHFFNATTLAVGANVASNNNMYGHENFGMLLSGIGNKTGYNFEFKNGKIILQPSLLLSYTFVNTFDYTNAAGVKIENKPLHALQLSPGVKVIGNLKDGWQPYLSVAMVWNVMGESHATANGVKLPEMSVKPYVQYGLGVQKRMKNHFTAYGQAMLQNGGRNGITLTTGLRWDIGKNKNETSSQNINQRKNIKAEKLNNHNSVKKVIKELNTDKRS